MLKYLKYLSLIAQVVDAAKVLRKGKTAEAEAPLSVNGVRGTLIVSWAPDSALK
jgi:hypothetical protein